jgi:uncharacterized membrane protein
MPAQGNRRIAAVDLARGVALLAMAVYHFAWDLEFFGYADPGMTAEGGWKLFARLIASSFLFLVGVSLVLGHGNGIRWRGFWRRWTQVAASAGANTLITWYAFPDGFIFFGILHQIALASLLGLPFLRLPAWAVLLAAMFALAAPYWLRGVAFDAPWLLWLGLSTTLPRSNDYVPLFPWFGAVLAGIAAARLGQRLDLWTKLAAMAPPPWTAPVSFAGRHSLAFYLIHQPLLIASLWLFALAFPADRGSPEEQILRSCVRTCADVRDDAFCTRYCACVLDTLVVENRLDEAFGESQNEETRRWLGEVAGQCTREADLTLEGGTGP